MNLNLTPYHVYYLDSSGILRGAFAAASSPGEAIRKIAACEPRYLRATRAIRL